MNILNVLFVCKNGLARSITAEKEYKKLCKQRGIEVKTSSAGLFPRYEKRDIIENICHYFGKYILRRQLTKKQADNANIIFAMDRNAPEVLIQDYKQSSQKILKAYIEDNHWVMFDPKLRQLSQEALLEYI